MEYGQIDEVEPYTPYVANASTTHLHATLQHIDDLANEDVEMKAPLSELHASVVIDTNILLHHLDTLKQFVEDAERVEMPLSVIIPGVVIYELDRQKNQSGLGWYSRRASTWLLDKVKEKKTVKGQANDETCKPSGNWKIINVNDIPERRNDELVLDCCRFYLRRGTTWLISDDKNLCIDAHSFHAGAFRPTGKTWSSRDIAQSIWKEALGEAIYSFERYRPSYEHTDGKKTARQKVQETVEDEDKMIVDEEEKPEPESEPSHLLDRLHEEVIEHFTKLLLELVRRVGGDEVARERSGGAAVSMYAPEWQRKATLSDWNAHDCVEYLCEKRRVKRSNPGAGLFLSYPYKRTGARRGQDWSRRDWEVALGQLAEIGTVWEDWFLAESAGSAPAALEKAFAQKMRPTGI